MRGRGHMTTTRQEITAPSRKRAPASAFLSFSHQPLSARASCAFAVRALDLSLARSRLFSPDTSRYTISSCLRATQATSPRLMDDIPAFAAAQAGQAHPNFAQLTLQVFEAVVEVVCIALPGYVVARSGNFGAAAQKAIANLNMTLFTPCLSTYRGSSPIRPRLTFTSLHKACEPAHWRSSP